MNNKELANKKIEEKIRWYYQNVDMNNDYNKASLFMEAFTIGCEFLSENKKQAIVKRFVNELRSR